MSKHNSTQLRVDWDSTPHLFILTQQMFPLTEITEPMCFFLLFQILIKAPHLRCKTVNLNYHQLTANRSEITIQLAYPALVQILLTIQPPFSPPPPLLITVDEARRINEAKRTSLHFTQLRGEAFHNQPQSKTVTAMICSVSLFLISGYKSISYHLIVQCLLGAAETSEREKKQR